MLIVEDLDHLSQRFKHPVMAIGVFDGVHLGHQAVLRRVVERAREKGGNSMLLTFVPHPQKVIAPRDAPLSLQTDQQKQDVLRQFEIDVMVRLPFTREISLYSPEQFAHKILYDHGIREILVGSNFRFGHRRSGDFKTLQSVATKLGIVVDQIQPVCFRSIPVSSTKIRQLLKQGTVSLANRLLTRPYQLQGTIVRGSQKGSELGFPTANLNLDNELIPATGVYVSRAYIDENAYPSVTNVGYRPTLHHDHHQEPVVESYLLDYHGDLYGKTTRVDFYLRLRAERQFENADALKRQIERDIARGRKYLNLISPVVKEDSLCR